MICKECQHKKLLIKHGNITAQVFCNHPDKQYIDDYFRENRISKMQGFIGFVNSQGVFPIKKAPKWCPLKAERSEGK